MSNAFEIRVNACLTRVELVLNACVSCVVFRDANIFYQIWAAFVVGFIFFFSILDPRGQPQGLNSKGVGGVGSGHCWNWQYITHPVLIRDQARNSVTKTDKSLKLYQFAIILISQSSWLFIQCTERLRPMQRLQNTLVLASSARVFEGRVWIERSKWWARLGRVQTVRQSLTTALSCSLSSAWRGKWRVDEFDWVFVKPDKLAVVWKVQ